ncbi:hypothetical protein [Polynucleobacter asymbioticus]|uniref:hypothetical protein n=1 Tax=Polynucleobacter asymbioticus TaxID=576611 RepID=UPI0008F7F455|nr:hypothetical protein [Polynucleobacter asymbioticus]
MGIKILVRLAGGLGNQLFQIAKAMQLTDDFKDIFISTQHLKKYKTFHDYVLPNVINTDIFNVASSFDDYIMSARLPKLIEFSIFGISLVSDRRTVSSQSKVRYSILDGYFQSESLDNLKILNKILLRQMKPVNEVVIHVRGGDLIRLGYPIQEINQFYKKALEKATQFSDKSYKYKVITDDIKFTSALPSLNGYEVLTGKIEDDFYRIGSSRVKVFYNSTFAITASALGFDNSICISSGKNLDGKKRQHLIKNELIVDK